MSETETETGDEYHDETSEIEDWSAEESPKPPQTRKVTQATKPKPKPQSKAARPGRQPMQKNQVTQLVKQTKDLSIAEDVDSDDSAAVLPQQKAEGSMVSSVLQPSEAKKKKR